MKAKLLILCLSIASLFLAEKLTAQDLYFSPDIINILDNNNCLGCHGSTGGLNLNTYAQALAGGNNCGPAFIPFDADNSPLVNKIDPSVPVCAGGAMPPAGSVSAADIASIRLWIEQGALEFAPPVCEDLVISAYVEGSSQNKCIEIFNGTANDIDLATYSLDVYSNGNTEVNSSFALEGTIAAGGYFLVCHTEADLPGITVDVAANLNYNGNDAVALNNGTNNIDVVGQIGVNPDDAWVNGDCSTSNNTLIKVNIDTPCGFATNDGTGDFSDALGNLYACFPSNDVTQLNSYVEPIACPTLALTDGEIDINVCSGTAAFLNVAVTEATADDVVWSDGSTGTNISTGILTSGCEGQTLTFTASVAAGTVDACDEEVSVTFTVTVLPDLTAGAALNVDDENCTISVSNVCEGASVSFTVNDGDAQDGNSYTAAAGETSSINFFVTDNELCGNTATFSSEISCEDVVTPCPTLTLPDDAEAEITVCAGTEIFLDVVVTEATAEDVVWSDGSAGTNISTGVLTSGCEGQTLTFTASVAAGTIDGCDEDVSLSFTVIVLPDLTAGAELNIDDANCTISIINACEAANITFIVNDFDEFIIDGNSYTASEGTTANVDFFVEDEVCGNTATFSSEISCDDVVNPCAELSAVGETSLTVCSGETLDLNVVIANGDISAVSWMNGEVGATASYLATQTTDCDGFTDVFSASYVDNTGGNCSETITIDFTITVLPNPADVVSLEISTASCSINLLNACDDFEVSYVVNGGEAQTGSTYQAFASSFSEVTFTTTAQCGTTILDAILDCETVPIELLGNITGHILETGNLLKWTTASEYNNAFFTLATSIDGKNFETIAKITGAGTSNLAKNYEFLDENAKAGTTYYQLTQTDFDGTSKNLGIINLRRGNDNLSNLNVYPIPSTAVVNLNFDSAISQDLVIKIYDLTGKLVAQKVATTIIGNNVLPINIETYIAGTYFITLNNETVNMSAKFVKY